MVFPLCGNANIVLLAMPSAITHTPVSELEAMAEAQRELYEMLGISRDDLLQISPGAEQRRPAVSNSTFRRRVVPDHRVSSQLKLLGALATSPTPSL
jgi:hypothetical protein